MTVVHPFGNDPAKIERYRAFWNRDPVDRPLVGFSFVGWYPLQYFSVSKSWNVNDRITPDMLQPQQWLDDYEKRTGVSIPMHIDGASGGFVNPFLYPDYEWDFRLPRVQSINASGHKFGLVPPGLGWVVFKERSIFNEDLVFYVNYLGGESATATLNFSRNASPIIAQAYQFMRLGFDGYKRIMEITLENAEHLRDRLMDSGYFDIMNESQRIPVVALTLK